MSDAYGLNCVLHTHETNPKNNSRTNLY